MIEAGLSFTIFPLIQKPGPAELIIDNFNGINFENNNISSFIKKFSIYDNLKNKKLLVNI